MDWISERVENFLNFEASHFVQTAIRTKNYLYPPSHSDSKFVRVYPRGKPGYYTTSRTPPNRSSKSSKLSMPRFRKRPRRRFRKRRRSSRRPKFRRARRPKRRRRRHSAVKHKNMARVKLIKTGIVSCAQGQVGHEQFALCTTTDLETLCQNVPHIDDVGALVTNDIRGANGAQLHIHRSKMFMEMRNNDVSTMEINFFWVKCIQSSEVNAIDRWTEGATEVGILDPAVDPQYLYGADLWLSHKYWRTLKSWNITLRPGQQYRTMFTLPAMTYRPDELDTTSNVYLKNKAHILVMRVRGVVGHSAATPSNVSLTGGQIDVIAWYDYMYYGALDKVQRFYGGLDVPVIGDITLKMVDVEDNVAV